MSVDPAAGSTVSRPTTITANAAKTRIDGRAPRVTAINPAMTPTPPTTTAAHRTKVSRAGDGCSQIHHGGPAAGRGMLTTDRLGPARETATMTATEATMPVAATQPRMNRRRSGAGWSRTWVAGGIEVATGASEYAGRAGRSSPFALLNLPACPIGIDADTHRTYRIRPAPERQGEI